MIVVGDGVGWSTVCGRSGSWCMAVWCVMGAMCDRRVSQEVRVRIRVRVYCVTALPHRGELA